MHRLRATSYLRRNISEPQSHRRFSAMSAIVGNQFSREISDQLLESTNEGQSDTEKPKFTLESDMSGIGILFRTKLNMALLFVPLGICSHFKFNHTATFWLNFAALIPLSALLGNVTEELALHTGDLFGGLMNATFGNAVEMIITVQALRAGLVDIVQGTLLGSILSNLLLVLGTSFFFGGLFHHVQKFNAQGATCSTSLLLLASLAFIAPTVANGISQENNLTISRLIALLIAMTYSLFLFFQLGTHFSIFKGEQTFDDGANDEAEDWPIISCYTAIILLLLITILISVNSEFLIGSIESLSSSSGIPKNFIGVILLPIVGNAAEHATAVTVAIKNKPDLTMGVAIGSSTQIALFMVPFAVLVGWIMNVPMTLTFSNVAAAVLTFSVLIVMGVVQDGVSNWLEGVMLITAYCIIAIVFWFDGSDGK